MNNDVIVMRNETVIAAEINAVKRQVARNCLSAAIEIGRLLTEAKALVPFGRWGEWLEENCAYSQSTANNLMRLCEEYGEQAQVGFFEENRMEIFGDLTPSQAVALLGLPREERQGYVESHDMTETSVRDIQEEIRARKAAEDKLAAAEQTAAENAENAGRLAEQLAAAEQQAAQTAATAAAAVAERVKKAVAEESEKLKEKLAAEAEKKIAAETEGLQQQVAEAQKTAEQAAAEKDEIAERVRAEAEAAYKAQLDALEQKAAAAEKRAANAGNGAVQKFSVHFALLQQEHRELLGILRELRQQGETETADKLHGALQKLVTAMGQTEQEVLA